MSVHDENSLTEKPSSVKRQRSLSENDITNLDYSGTSRGACFRRHCPCPGFVWSPLERKSQEGINCLECKHRPIYHEEETSFSSDEFESWQIKPKHPIRSPLLKKLKKIRKLPNVSSEFYPNFAKLCTEISPNNLYGGTHRCRHCPFSTTAVTRFTGHMTTSHFEISNVDKFCEKCPYCRGLTFSRGDYLHHHSRCLTKLKEDIGALNLPKEPITDLSIENNSNSESDTSEEEESDDKNVLYFDFEQKYQHFKENGYCVEYICRHCDAQLFMSAESFLKHVEAEHGYEKTGGHFLEKCPLCGLILFYDYNFKNHMKHCIAKFNIEMKEFEENAKSRQSPTK